MPLTYRQMDHLVLWLTLFSLRDICNLHLSCFKTRKHHFKIPQTFSFINYIKLISIYYIWFDSCIPEMNSTLCIPQFTSHSFHWFWKFKIERGLGCSTLKFFYNTRWYLIQTPKKMFLGACGKYFRIQITCKIPCKCSWEIGS